MYGYTVNVKVKKLAEGFIAGAPNTFYFIRLIVKYR